MATPTISWTRLVPSPDPVHGSPCARSSHGLSIVQNKNNGNTTRLILLGGEHVARTPIDISNSYWAADKVVGEGDEDEWKWRLLNNTPGGEVPPDRIAHAQAVCDDAVYIFGGRAGITMEEKAMNDLWKLDCSGPAGTERWVAVTAKGGNPPEPRSFHRMIGIDKNLYVFGGCSANHGRLADLHRFDLETQTWHDLTASPLLRGRGGANLIPLCGGQKIGVVAGFCGEETNDGHVFDLATGTWEEKSLNEKLQDMRPRSVCVSGSLPSTGYSLIFGGEVDPSDRGHEGAGAFENDLVLLKEESGAYITSLKASPESSSSSSSWPQTRGWSDAVAVDAGNGTGSFYFFGGLSGDDQNPQRLDDLWMLKIQK